MYPSFNALLGLTLGGVSLHNALQYVVRRVTAPAVAKVNQVAADVESGNVQALKHDAAGVVDFVETHAPSVAKKVDELRASAEDEITKARHAAAEELRKLAESVEKASGVTPSAVAPEAPQAPVQG